MITGFPLSFIATASYLPRVPFSASSARVVHFLNHTVSFSAADNIRATRVLGGRCV